MVVLCALLAGCTTNASGATSDEAQPQDSDSGDRFASCGDPGVLCYEFGPIEVPPGEEWQGFSAFDVGNDADLAITGMEIDQVGTTSHHFTVALWTGAEPPMSGGPYELSTPEGLSFVGDVLGNTLVGSVFKYVKIDNGKYVGVSLPSHAYIVNNGHYVNATTETAVGRTRVLIRTAPKETVRFTTINALPGTTAIDVPPGETRTVGATYVPDRDIAVLLMTSHMHRHGTLFEAWSVIDGQKDLVYSTTNYEAPPLQIYATKDTPPLVLRAVRGDHLEFACTHANDDLDFALTYGPSADSNEMCILPIYYIEEPDALLDLIATGGDGTGFSWEYVPYGGS